MGEINLHERSDEQLIEFTRSGVTRAYAILWDRHVEFATNTARSQTSSLDCEDMVAEAFTRIFELISQSKLGGPSKSFRAYLFVTIRNLAAEWGRKRREFTVHEQEWFETLTAESSPPVDDLEDEKELAVLSKAFHSLPIRWQETLFLSEVEELSPAQLATAFGVAENAVWQLAFRAREGLRVAYLGELIPINDSSEQCRWASQRMASAERNKLGKRDQSRFIGHLTECTKCSELRTHTKEIASRLYGSTPSTRKHHPVPRRATPQRNYALA